MKARPFLRRPSRRQRGQTLISMMVGLVISLLTIAAMLAIYKMMIEISGNASRSALRDGQVALAMLATQIEMQQAGYAIPETDTQPRIDVSEERVVWRYRAGTSASATSCAGVEILRQASGAREAGVYALTPSACASPNGWVADGYSLLASKEAFFVPVNRDGTAMTDEVGANLLANAVFEHKDGSAGDACGLPYAQQLGGTAPSSQRVILKAGDDTDAGILFSVCLPNLAAATSGGAGTAPDGAS
ncbi:prepilin-type N-terminal cleavage/methylation domain-containing protein [Xanthomonas sp. XNM01]|uniref:PilW family protein n=1 Tax=Xanthomonas sp. XNM01 TaxID=2769289 RepID=UPI0017815C89|nr:prepilin-type N-terminal cleavage/methylation domain-containing protein [Xanthomonas sp. XNM01]MBD9370244.1 prepilin-type N-terminal cleavage/methylation domain-containing protein [Xanthomonas sp. XNM01]